MAGMMCVTVGEAQVHLDQLAAAVTTAEGYALSREQWGVFILKVVQALLAAFAVPAPPAPTEVLPHQAGLPPEQAGPPQPNKPRPR